MIDTGSREDCDFCGIARGHTGDVWTIHEADTWLAFFPLRPATPGHTLIIPRLHVENLWEATPDLGRSLMAASVAIGKAITRALHAPGMNLITSKGEAAEQSVFHLHLHIVPRWPDDSFGPIWPEEPAVSEIEIADLATRIRVAFG